MTLTGNEIRALRESFHLSQSELAHFLGVVLSTVYRWEACKMKPPGPTPRLLSLLAAVPPSQRVSLHLRQVLQAGGAWRAMYAVLKAVYPEG